MVPDLVLSEWISAIDLHILVMDGKDPNVADLLGPGKVLINAPPLKVVATPCPISTSSVEDRGTNL